MKSQTSLIAQQTRLRKWTEQIKECQNRPQGMKIDEWCQMHGISKANYYWTFTGISVNWYGLIICPGRYL